MKELKHRVLMTWIRAVHTNSVKGEITRTFYINGKEIKTSKN